MPWRATLTATVAAGALTLGAAASADAAAANPDTSDIADTGVTAVGQQPPNGSDVPGETSPGPCRHG